MKFSALLFAGLGMMALAAEEKSLLRSGANSDAQRELWKTEFDKISVYYDPAYDPCEDTGDGRRALTGDGDGPDCKKYPKCVLKYEIPHYPEVKIVFDPEYIFEEGHKVKCSMDYKPPKGTKLPIDVKVPLKYVTWVGATPTDASVKWGLKSWSKKDAHRLDVVILREPYDKVIPGHTVTCPGQKVEWKALYQFDPVALTQKCTLTYSVNKGAHVTIPAEVIFGGADTGAVKCVAHLLPPENKDTLCLPIVDEDITDSAFYVGKDVLAALVNWQKDGYLKWEIAAADPEPFVATAKYTPHAVNDPPCVFSYEVAGTIVTVKFKKEEVFEPMHGDYVICKKKEHPKGGLALPISVDLPNTAATWAGAVVRDFEVRWGDDKGNNHLEVLIKRNTNCPEIVEDIIWKKSLKPKGVLVSTSPQGQALAWVQSVYTCGTDSLITLIQAYALATFFFAAGGPSWVNNLNWVGTDVNPCSATAPWFGVTCVGNIVTGIELPANGLVGSLTPEIGLLQYLLTLDVSSNNLSGEIPETLGKLKDLEFLYLQGNAFMGSIVPEICDIIVNSDDLIVDSMVHCPQGCCTLVPS